MAWIWVSFIVGFFVGGAFGMVGMAIICMGVEHDSL